jgi:hypothetical protein
MKGLLNFSKSSGMWVFIIIVVVFIVWLLMSYSSKKGLVKDNFANPLGGSPVTSKPAAFAQSTQQQGASNAGMVSNASLPSNAAPSIGSGYVGQAVADPSQLLPKDKNSDWSKLNPSINSDPMIPDLLQAGSLIGLDTIGQTLKNANLQLRSDPIIVKQNVGPWNNSTYEADLGRVPLELGCGAP